MAKKNTYPSLIQATPRHTHPHARTQDSNMGVLLDAVTLDDWLEVVTWRGAGGKRR
jgi:hypothetical protein